jgi:hypothetical protein
VSDRRQWGHKLVGVEVAALVLEQQSADSAWTRR